MAPSLNSSSTSPKKVSTSANHTISSLDPQLKSAINTALLNGGYLPQIQSRLTDLLVQPLASKSGGSSSAASAAAAAATASGESSSQRDLASAQVKTLQELIVQLTLDKMRELADSKDGATYPNLAREVRKEIARALPDDAKERKDVVEFIRGILEDVVSVKQH
jgi:hypothetical protein